jgi:Fibronectin type III domain
MTCRQLTPRTVWLVPVIALALLLAPNTGQAATSSSYPNVVFSDGFESGSLGAWDGAFGTGLVGVLGSAAHSGANGLRITNSPGQYALVLKKLDSPLADSSVSFWARVAPGGGLQTLAQARDLSSSLTMWGLLYDGNQQALWFYPYSGTGSREIFTGAGSAPVGSWFKVEVQYTATSTGGAQLYVNGQTRSDWGASGDYTRSANLQRLQLWDDSSATTDFDDVTVAAPSGGPAPTVPGAPTGVQGSAGDGSVSLSWTAPSSDGGSAITGYRITPYVGASAQTAVTTTGSATSRTITGLTNGTAYTFKVAATNSVGTGADSSASAAITPAAAVSGNPIQVENSQPGDPNWGDFAEPPDPTGISGYGSRISVNHGQSIDFYVTTTASSVTIDVFRMGWYGGAGARLMSPMGTFPGVNQPQALPDRTTGMVTENWTRTATLNVPASWTTGVYIARLKASNGYGAMIFFVVRDDGGTEPILFQTSVNTYQAYNVYGGTSLYNNNTNKSVYSPPHATKVSFDRPFLNGDGAGQFLSYEYPFVRWLERQGYNAAYTTDVDTSAGTNPLTNHKAFLAVGHDEYWSKGMRDNVEAAIAAGVDVGFFAGNESYWQVRYENNAAGVSNRVLVGYKDLADCTCAGGPDPMFNVNNALLTALWRDPRVGRPEESMMGAMFGGEVNNATFTVKNASHWVFTGTGWSNGTKVPGIVGYEYDHYFGDAGTPPNTTVLAETPVVNTENNQPDTADTTIYRAPSGAWVFEAGTIQWSWGLDNFGGTSFVNAGIQKVTSNILDAFTGVWTPPGG